MPVSRTHVFVVLTFAAFALCSPFLTPRLLGQEIILSGGRTTEEQQLRRTFAPALAEMAWTRLSSNSPAPQGAVMSPEPTLDRKIAYLTEALVEEATYRVRRAIEAIVYSVQPQYIIDGSWMKVTNTTAVPYRGVCQIAITFPKKKNGAYIVAQGTAFFVSPRVLMTSGHSVYSHDYGGWARQIEVTPGRNGNHLPYGSQTAYTTSTLGEWIGDEHEDYDIGWIILPDRTLYDRTGFYFGLATTTNKFLASETLRSAQFPDPFKYKYQMYWDYAGRDQDVRTRHFLHYHDVAGGSSGSPMYYVKNGDRYVVGVVEGEVQGTKERWNLATRIIAGYIQITRDLSRSNP